MCFVLYISIVIVLTRNAVETSSLDSSGSYTSLAYCITPMPPKHGTYTVDGIPTYPGSILYTSFTINMKCDKGYRLQGMDIVRCSNGVFSEAIPTCVKQSANVSSGPDIKLRMSVAPSVCEAPEYPKHGTYHLNGIPHPQKANAYEKLNLTVTCNPWYKLHGDQVVRCENGQWSSKLPTCEYDSVNFYCQNLTELIPCGEDIRPGTEVFPSCKENYKYEGKIPKMTCGEEGYFDHVVICVPDSNFTECGLSSVNHPLISGGLNAEPGEVPWHAGIYTKNMKPYMQICGGSIVTSIYVISAAHCFFYADSKVDSSLFGVAVGKIYRAWNASADVHAQLSDVAEIHTPMLFFGSLANYQCDIALVKLATAIEFNRFVMPICLNFTDDVNSQLEDGSLGKVAGWGLMSMDGNPSPFLKTTFLPFISLNKCINESLESFKVYINADKICAGYNNGTAVCKGDSGGGLDSYSIIS
ncbi:hypothetical protein K1T71_014473 [Dendrolimus kikuchii]|uniref:Uncharacterized protein n=1 Tax=Dendrolimus kikuchii TaxID=765133 RepID=A0ACC1CEI0_9NEOP|nr:hypothetical protein K1T71_014473 [Dendrolimus kikuchii]